MLKLWTGTTNVQNHPKQYLCRLSRNCTLSFQKHHSPGLQANTCKHPVYLSCTSVPLSPPQSNTLCWDPHAKTHSALHRNHNRLLSNYFWSQPSWPGHCLSVVAWDVFRQNSDRWEGGQFFFMCNAALPAYMPPRRCLHNGSMLILINT